MKKHLLPTLASLAALFGIAMFGGSDASAASVTLTPGDNVQAAINQATAGDTITFGAGTYTLPAATYINITGKEDVTLVGNGVVKILYDGGDGYDPATKQAVKIFDSHDITLDNLTFERTGSNEGDSYTASSGMNIAGSCDINLDSITISGFSAKSGIDIAPYSKGGTESYIKKCVVTADTPSTFMANITFQDVTITGNRYGILFNHVPYGVLSAGLSATNVGGIQFLGTNTISDGDYGIVVNNNVNSQNLRMIYGVGGATLSFGTVDIETSSGQFLISLKSGNLSSMSMDSYLNGKLVSTMTYKEFCDIVGKYIIPEGICDDAGNSAMAGFNCVCYEDFKDDPDALIGFLTDPDSSCAVCAEGPCIDPCPDGTIPDENGDCIIPCDPGDPNSPGYPCVDPPEETCPDGSMPDENGNCEIPCDPNDPNSPGYPCVPNTGAFGSGSSLDTSSIIIASAIGVSAILASAIVVRRVRRTTRIRL